jgi:hypothetical protein
MLQTKPASIVASILIVSYPLLDEHIYLMDETNCSLASSRDNSSNAKWANLLTAMQNDSLGMDDGDKISPFKTHLSNVCWNSVADGHRRISNDFSLRNPD